MYMPLEFASKCNQTKDFTWIGKHTIQNYLIQWFQTSIIWYSDLKPTKFSLEQAAKERKKIYDKVFCNMKSTSFDWASLLMCFIYQGY